MMYRRIRSKDASFLGELLNQLLRQAIDQSKRDESKSTRLIPMR